MTILSFILVFSAPFFGGGGCATSACEWVCVAYNNNTIEPCNPGWLILDLYFKNSKLAGGGAYSFPILISNQREINYLFN